HVGTLGNEAADAAAKDGGQLQVMGPEPFVPVSQALLEGTFRESNEKKWNNEWLERTDCRQTKNWFPKVDRRKSIGLLKNTPRDLYGKVLQFITGHNFLNRHSSLIDPTKGNQCRYCEQAQETSWHLCVECPRLNH